MRHFFLALIICTIFQKERPEKTYNIASDLTEFKIFTLA